MTERIRLQLLRGDPGSDPAAPETRSLLVHAARAGDVRAFAELVDTYYARCLRFALHMLASRDDAEEAVQDTFVRVYRALPSYEEREAFEPWLFRILANRCRTAGGRARRHADLVEYGDVPDRASGHAEDETFAWRDAIQSALASLPRPARSIPHASRGRPQLRSDVQRDRSPRFRTQDAGEARL